MCIKSSVANIVRMRDACRGFISCNIIPSSKSDSTAGSLIYILRCDGSLACKLAKLTLADQILKYKNCAKYYKHTNNDWLQRLETVLKKCFQLITVISDSISCLEAHLTSDFILN